MKYFDKILKDLLKEIKEKDMDLGQILYEARLRLGIFQYRVADFTGISSIKLKKLENNRFIGSFKDEELERISNFYEFPLEMIKKKAKEYTEARRIKTKAQRYFSHETMQCLQKAER